MPTQIEPATLRAAMSRFPTGVTVVTAMRPRGAGGRDRERRRLAVAGAAR